MMHPTRYVWLGSFLVILAAIATLLSSFGYHPWTRGSLAGSNSINLKASYAAYDSGDTDGAITAADALLHRDPKDISALLAKAAALAEKGSMEFKEREYGLQAIEVARLALTIDPQSSEAWRQIGYAYEIMQEYDMAHDAYGKAITLDENNALAIAGDAHAWDLQGDMDKAQGGYERALAIDSSLIPAKVGLARAYMYRAEPEKALALFKEVAASASNARMRADAAYSAGQIEELSGAFDDAKAHFDLAVKTDPRYAPGWVGLSAELFRQATAKGSRLSPQERSSLASESLEDVQKAIELNPNQSTAHFQLATEMVVMGRLDDAILILNGLHKKIIDEDTTLSFIAKEAMRSKVRSALDNVRKMQMAK